MYKKELPFLEGFGDSSIQNYVATPLQCFHSRNLLVAVQKKPSWLVRPDNYLFRSRFSWSFFQKEYMDRQISQKVEFYRREEKRLSLYFDQFCNLLSLKHVLQYTFNQIMWANVLKRHSRRLKGQKRP